MESLTTIKFEPSATIDVSGDLNLSDTRLPAPDERKYFEAIQDLLETYADNYDAASPNKDVQGEAAAVKTLAETIAKDIRNKVFDIMDTKIGQDHFDRVVKGNDDYSFIVYDFRDDAALTNRKAADATVNTTSRVTYRMQVEETEGTTVTVTGGQPLKIQCSSGLNDSIDIFLPSLSLGDMKLHGYQIYMYRSLTEYSEAYQEKLKAWEDSAEEEVHTVTYMAKVIDSQIPPIYGTKYVNGEPQRFLIQAGSTTYKEEERTRTYSTKKYGPKPDAEPGDIMVKREYAPDSLWLVDNAISMVSAARAGLGATHNRLEHAYNIDTNSEENTQAAESRIRDADMAKEMVEYSKSNLLAQAGQAMLAQANQSNQGVLSLLQ